MNRIKLWDVSCSTRDAILATSFTWEELENISACLGFEMEPPKFHEDSCRGSIVLLNAHRICHSRNVFSEHLQTILDSIHSEAIEFLNGKKQFIAFQWATGDLEKLPVSLPGLMWALASDPRSEMRSVEQSLLWRSQTEGFRALAFGKVELIEVSV